MNVRSGLGRYIPRTGNLPAKALTLHDLGELIRRAGLAAGFVVESEFTVPPASKQRSKLRIDWVWLTKEEPDKPVVTFEIEGQDADPRSIEMDVKKFRLSGAPICVLALFQVDHDRMPKRKPPGKASPKQWVKKHLKGFQAHVFMDTELMARGGIEKLRRSALQHSVRRQR